MNAVIYARYSSSSQTEQSIEGQLRDCYSFAEREGFTIVGEYVDRAISGRSDDRPDFQRMISDAPKKQFQTVLVWKLDRFARNRYDSAIYKAKLRKYSVKVVSATENIGNNPEGIILEGMLESMAEYYSANLSKHVKRGLRESALKGSFTGGTPPIGYKAVNKKIVIDEDKAPIIKYAFEQYAKGVPKREIIDALNAKGIKNNRGNPLSLTSFQAALKNKKYIGINNYNGIISENTYPPLIDIATFEKVQERLNKVRHAPAAAKAKVEYFLRGKAFCGYCGTGMVGDAGTGKLGTKYHYYACGKKKKHHTCHKKNEKKDFLEWYVVEQTLEYVLIPARMELIAEMVVKEYDKEFNNSKLAELERRMAKIERDINKCVDLMIETNSKAIQKRTEKKVEALELQKVDLEIDISKYKIANGIRYTKEDIISWLKLFCNGDLMDVEFRRRIIDVFINSIYLYDDKLVIYYNIKNSKQVSYIDMCENTNTAENTQNGGTGGGASVRISNDLAES